jgi:hypothetical protein
MILYNVRNGVISVDSVLRETRCGWRTKIGGFYNKSKMGKFVRLEETFFTTDYKEAIEWQKRTLSLLSDILQVAQASKSDIDFWLEHLDSDELNMPDSRYVSREV